MQKKVPLSLRFSAGNCSHLEWKCDNGLCLSKHYESCCEYFSDSILNQTIPFSQMTAPFEKIEQVQTVSCSVFETFALLIEVQHFQYGASRLLSQPI